MREPAGILPLCPASCIWSSWASPSTTGSPTPGRPSRNGGSSWWPSPRMGSPAGGGRALSRPHARDRRGRLGSAGRRWRRRIARFPLPDPRDRLRRARAGSDRPGGPPGGIPLWSYLGGSGQPSMACAAIGLEESPDRLAARVERMVQAGAAGEDQDRARAGRGSPAGGSRAVPRFDGRGDANGSYRRTSRRRQSSTTSAWPTWSNRCRPWTWRVMPHYGAPGHAGSASTRLPRPRRL